MEKDLRAAITEIEAAQYHAEILSEIVDAYIQQYFSLCATNFGLTKVEISSREATVNQDTDPDLGRSRQDILIHRDNHFSLIRTSIESGYIHDAVEHAVENFSTAEEDFLRQVRAAYDHSAYPGWWL